MINKVRKISEYAIIIMVFCVKFGAKEAEGHGIVLVAAPLRLCWLTLTTIIHELCLPRGVTGTLFLPHKGRKDTRM